MGFLDWVSSWGNYTEMFVSALEKEAEGQHSEAIAAIQGCSNIWGLGISSADVRSDDDNITRAITPDMLEQVGRDLLIHGESLWWIQDAGALFLPISSYQIDGGPRESTWRYHFHLPAPTRPRETEIRVGSEEILHFKWNPSKYRPWQGRSPLMLADDIGIAVYLASYIQKELRLNNDQILAYSGKLSSPEKDEKDDQKQEQKDVAAQQLNRLRPINRVRATDAKMLKMGPKIDPGAVALRKDIRVDIALAAGVPPGLVTAAASGTAAREDLRRGSTQTIMPISNKIQRELRDKVDGTVIVDAGALVREGDIASRARGFQSLVGGGMDVEEAASLSGLMAQNRED